MAGVRGRSAMAPIVVMVRRSLVWADGKRHGVTPVWLLGDRVRVMA